MRPIPTPFKLVPALVLSAMPGCRYRRMVLLVGHMRSGSTPLASILCSHPDVSGYGETHVRHGERGAIGAVVLNQWRRGAWRPRAPLLFDKILHNGYDRAVPPAFFEARFIVLARPPVATIRSINAMAATLRLTSWTDPASAADYYEGRMVRLLALWERMAPARRLGLTHARLLAEPERELARVTAFLGLEPPLANAYRMTVSAPGGGDPIVAPRHNRIVPQLGVTAPPDAARVALPAARIDALDALYREVVATVAGEPVPAAPLPPAAARR